MDNSGDDAAVTRDRDAQQEIINERRQREEEMFMQREAEKRKKNVIIEGIDESIWGVEGDKAVIGDMLRDMGVCHFRDLVSVERIGRNVNGRRPRLIIATFSTKSAVYEIIYKGKNLLRTNRFFKVFVRRDLTRSEREEEKMKRHNRKTNGVYTDSSTNTDPVIDVEETDNSEEEAEQISTDEGSTNAEEEEGISESASDDDSVSNSGRAEQLDTNESEGETETEEESETDTDVNSSEDENDSENENESENEDESESEHEDERENENEAVAEGEVNISDVQTSENDTVNTVEVGQESAVNPMSEEVAEHEIELEDFQNSVNEEAQITEEASGAREGETEMVLRRRSPGRSVVTRSRSAARRSSGNGENRKVLMKTD